MVTMKQGKNLILNYGERRFSKAHRWEQVLIALLDIERRQPTAIFQFNTYASDKKGRGSRCLSRCMSEQE